MEFEDAPPIQQSYLHWYVTSLGWPTLGVIVGVTLLAMGLIVLLFFRGRGPAVPAAMVFVLPLPLLVGLLCFLSGSISFLSNLSMDGPREQGASLLSYATLALLQSSSCFCPLLLLTLTLLMVLGFAANRKPDPFDKVPKEFR